MKLNHPNTSKTVIFLIGIVFLVGCSAGAKATPGQGIQPVQPSNAGIAPTSDKFPTPTEMATQAPELPTSVPVQPPVATLKQPQYPLPGIELSQMNAASLDLVAQAGAYWIRRNSLMWSAVEPNEGDRNWGALANLEQE